MDELVDIQGGEVESDPGEEEEVGGYVGAQGLSGVGAGVAGPGL